MVWGKKKKVADKPVDEPDELIDDGVEDDEWEDFDYEDEEEPKGPLKTRILKGIRSALISATVLVILAVGAGAVYVWYMDENAPPAETAFAAPVDPLVKKEVKPVQRDPNAPFGVSVQMLSTPVIPGSNAGITIKSIAGVTCAIVFEINKIPLKDSGLVDRPTDEYGVATWSWTLPADAPVGKWPATVTCTAPNKKSAVVRGDIEIVKTLPEE
jgi:hypothetical protein